jgi:hypothetical protein
MCGALSQETKGSLFDLNRLAGGNPKAQKYFAETFSKKVAMSALPSGCQECRCSEESTICKPCDTPNVTPKRSYGRRDENPYADEFKPKQDLDDEFKKELKDFVRRPMRKRTRQI